MQEGKKPILENTIRLEKFYKYLNYEVSSAPLSIGGIVIPFAIS